MIMHQQHTNALSHARGPSAPRNDKTGGRLRPVTSSILDLYWAHILSMGLAEFCSGELIGLVLYIKPNKPNLTIYIFRSLDSNN